VVIFIGILFALEASGIPATKPGLFALLFFTYVPIWIIAGMVWDKVTIKQD
jgi:hypothetical protein